MLTLEISLYQPFIYDCVLLYSSSSEPKREGRIIERLRAIGLAVSPFRPLNPSDATPMQGPAAATAGEDERPCGFSGGSTG